MPTEFSLPDKHIHASWSVRNRDQETLQNFGQKITRKKSMNLKVLEVHEKSDLVPAPVHKNKFDCVPRSNQETCMKCFYWKFTKNMIEFPFPLMKYELVRELSFIDCVLPIP